MVTRQQIRVGSARSVLTRTYETVRGTIRLADEIFAEHVQIDIEPVGEDGWRGDFTLPVQFTDSHLRHGGAKPAFTIELADGRVGRFRIVSFHFPGSHRVLVKVEGVGPLEHVSGAPLD